jgi:hypothetical protein
MESVAPPLALLLCVKRAIEKGQPVRVGILLYLKRFEGEFPEFLMRWMAYIQQGKDPQDILGTLTSMHRRILIQLLERGLRGEAIYPSLIQLESEIIEACQDELGTKLARLPFILLIPLLLFQFPAFLMLLFGPLLQNFFHSFGGG